MDHIVDTLIDYSGSQDEELRDIAGLGNMFLNSHLQIDTSIHSFEDSYLGDPP